jgi:hypothetical protein
MGVEGDGGRQNTVLLEFGLLYRQYQNTEYQYNI